MSSIIKLVKNMVSTSIRGAIANARFSGDAKHHQAWADYGYHDEVTFEMLYCMQERFGLARAGVMKPVTECWRTAPQIIEGSADGYDNREPTEFEKSFELFAKEFRLWDKCRNADRRQRVGKYGGLMVQVRGDGNVPKWSTPLALIRKSQIVKFIPFYEGQMKPTEWDLNESSERYGLPVSYNFQENFIGNAGEEQQRSLQVHWTRVIIFSEGAEDDSIYGDPCNLSGFNSLVTLEKLIGAGGEGFWKNAAQKMVFVDKNEDGVEPDPSEQEKIDAAIKAFAESMEKQLQIGGMDVKTLDSNLINPMPFFEVALNDYAASVDIPSKILIGAQTGRLAADEDGNAYLRSMMSRRENVCGKFVSDVVHWLFEHGVFRKVDFTVWWDDLLAPAQADKLALANKMADVNHKMTLHGLVFTPDEIRQVGGYSQPIAQVAPPPPDIDDEVEQEGLGGEGGQGLSTTEPQRAE